MKAIQYDPFFIVFGNDDLYIQQNRDELHISKDLGGSLSSFEIDKEEVKEFLGEADGVTKIKINAITAKFLCL